MTVRPRSGELPLDAGALLVHMGAGHAGDVIRAAMRNYAAYRPLRSDGYGYFTVSTYTLTAAFGGHRIVTAMRHGMFARVRAGALY